MEKHIDAVVSVLIGQGLVSQMDVHAARRVVSVGVLAAVAERTEQAAQTAIKLAADIPSGQRKYDDDERLAAKIAAAIRALPPA